MGSIGGAGTTGTNGLAEACAEAAAAENKAPAAVSLARLLKLVAGVGIWIDTLNDPKPIP